MAYPPRSQFLCAAIALIASVLCLEPLSCASNDATDPSYVEVGGGPGTGGSGGATAPDGASGAGGTKPEAGIPESSAEAKSDVVDSSIEAAPDSPNVTPGCFPIPSCDSPPWNPGPAREWRHWSSTTVVALGAGNHRGRDQFYNPGDTQWVLGKIAYGLTDKDLTDEEVDLYLLRDCAGDWEKVGTTLTTEEGAHETEEGVEDNGGRVYFEIPANKALGIGRHKVRLLVAGDLSFVDMYFEIVPPGTPVFVSDLDGTLTPNDTEEYMSLLTGSVAEAVPDSAAALQRLAARGYHPYYLTARPEWLTTRSQEFVRERGYPPGILHTSPSTSGATGSSAASFKTTDLSFLVKRGLTPVYAFGNADTDAEAYHNTGIPPEHAFFYKATDSTYGSRRIESYAELLPEFEALPKLCP